MKFHLDENVNHAIADGLRRRGIDVTIPVEVGLIQAEDIEHIEFAMMQGRVIVTQDEDMLILDSQGIAHAGICYWKMSTRTIGHVIRTLVQLDRTMSDDEITGKEKFI